MSNTPYLANNKYFLYAFLVRKHLLNFKPNAF